MVFTAYLASAWEMYERSRLAQCVFCGWSPCERDIPVNLLPAPFFHVQEHHLRFPVNVSMADTNMRDSQVIDEDKSLWLMFGHLYGGHVSAKYSHYGCSQKTGCTSMYIGLNLFCLDEKV